MLHVCTYQEFCKLNLYIRFFELSSKFAVFNFKFALCYSVNYLLSRYRHSTNSDVVLLVVGLWKERAYSRRKGEADSL